jgi:hypothetical protein
MVRLLGRDLRSRKNVRTLAKMVNATSATVQATHIVLSFNKGLKNVRCF